MDPWAVVEDLKDVRYLSPEIHAINQSFGISIDAVNQLIISKMPPLSFQIRMLDDAEKALFTYWMHMRHQLRERDKIMPSPVKTQMMTSNTLLPWLLMSKLHLYRVLFEYTVEESLVVESAEFSAWRLRPFADHVISNVEGMVVCNTPPCKMSPMDIRGVFYVFTSQWRTFHYTHHQRIYEYMEMMIRRLFILSAISPTASNREALHITGRVPDGMVYEFEIHAHTLMYNFFVTMFFKATPFSTRADFDETEYRITKFRLERWLRTRMENGKFDRIRAHFGSEMTNLCPRPTQRERMARIRGRKTQLISTREVLEDEEAQQNKLDEYLSTPNVVHKTLQGEIGTVFARQYLFVLVFDMFLSNNYVWEFKKECVYRESGLSDSNRLLELARTKDLPFLLCVCGTHMLVLDGELYPVSHFLDAMTQFILVTRHGDHALEYPGFYSDFLEIYGYRPSDAELETVSVDFGVYDLSLTDTRPQGFISDSESDDEAGASDRLLPTYS